MPLLIFPLGPEPLHFLDAPLHVGFGFLMAITLFENRLFLAAEIVLLFFAPSSAAGEGGLLSLDVSRPLGGFSGNGIGGPFVVGELPLLPFPPPFVFLHLHALA